MNKARLSPPWCEYRSQLEKLFEQDPEVSVDNAPGSDRNIIVRVSGNAAKADALQRILKPSVTFGDVEISVSVVPDNDTSPEGYIRTAFAGNPALVEVATHTDSLGQPVTYTLFAPRAVQFFNDDISNPEGKTTRLLQDVALATLAGHAAVRISSAPLAG